MLPSLVHLVHPVGNHAQSTMDFGYGQRGNYKLHISQFTEFLQNIDLEAN